MFHDDIIILSAGKRHILVVAAVTKEGVLWSWGEKSNGELGHGDEEHSQRPVRLSMESLLIHTP